LTPFKTNFGYGVNNDAVNTLIAKSPTLTAALNYLTQVEGYSLQMVTNGGETIVPTDATYGVIDLPISDANDPAGIVSTLAHEVGHALWGDVTLPASDALAMSEQQFVDAQVNQELQGEGVATLSNIKISEQIWPSTLTQYSEVNGISVDGASDVFANAYKGLSSGAESLAQAATAIGAFYAENEEPGLDRTKTYDQYYRGAADNLYKADEYHDLEHWRQQLESGQRTDNQRYHAALQAYLKMIGGGH
jgi:hypothetical protein